VTAVWATLQQLGMVPSFSRKTKNASALEDQNNASMARISSGLAQCLKEQGHLLKTMG
jgi:hypothetical protein